MGESTPYGALSVDSGNVSPDMVVLRSPTLITDIGYLVIYLSKLITITRLSIKK
jgi:hypothetical protein